MNIIKQLGIILGITYLGEIISKTVPIPLPGPVIGMILLFIMLYIGMVKVKSIEFLSELLLFNLAFFFIPPGVGILTSMDKLSGIWPKLLAVIVLTTIITILATAWIVDFVIKLRRKND
jgi:holin-like protein